jgi:hypothetical protein
LLLCKRELFNKTCFEKSNLETIIHFFFSFCRPSDIYIYIRPVENEARDSYIMFSGRGYCTQPTCFPVLGAPLIVVFLCKTHCGHMLCYRHWLSHQTSMTQEMDHSSSSMSFRNIKKNENVV